MVTETQLRDTLRGILVLKRAYSIGKWMLLFLILSAGAAWSSEPVSPPRVVLTGRLEELGGAGARLPIGMTMKGLRTQSPKVDSSAPSGYPNTWNGQWGGHLTVTKMWEQEPDPSASIHVGSRGVTVFSFIPAGVRTRLQPTDIYFPAHMLQASQAEYSAEQVSELRSKNRKLDPNALLMVVDVVRLRQAIAYNPFNHEQFDFSVLLNRLSRLVPRPSSSQPATVEQKADATGVMEQDIVVSTRTQKTRERSFTETVIRLSPVPDRPDLLWAQVAHIGYDRFGRSNRQLFMQGWLSTNWRSCATEIEKLQGRSVAQLGYQELCVGMSESTPVSPKLQGTVAENASRQAPPPRVTENHSFQGVSSYSGGSIKLLQVSSPQPVKPGKEIKPLVATPVKACPPASSFAKSKVIPSADNTTSHHIPANAHP